MRHLLNTLFITSEDAYLSLEGENVLVNREKIVVARFPLHTLSGILSFSYAGAYQDTLANIKQDMLHRH